MSENVFNAPAVKSDGAMVATEQHRAIQEVQAAMVIAKRFPRDQYAAYERIINACKRPTLAEGALYAYPRGGTTVTGPSIRLAEAVAQAWGNLQFGIRELSQSDGESEVEAFAWDVETNTRQVKVFKVRHQRKARGSIQNLTDPRDVYELVANQGARRLRACILGVIPGDVIESAVRQCEKTMQGNTDKPLEDRIRDMVVYFKELGVTKDMLEQRLGHKIEATIDVELVNMKKIYQSLRDGMSQRKDWFKSAEPPTTPESDEITEKLKAAAKEEDPPNQHTTYTPPSEPTDPADPDNWKNLRSGTFGQTGFSKYVEDNLEAFRNASPGVYDLAMDKWAKLYPDTPCKFSRDENDSDYEKEPKPEDDMQPDEDDDPQALAALQREWGICRAHNQTIAKYAMQNLVGKVEVSDVPISELSAKECRALISEYNELKKMNE